VLKEGYSTVMMKEKRGDVEGKEKGDDEGKEK
jgi:hypothetical protein